MLGCLQAAKAHDAAALKFRGADALVNFPVGGRPTSPGKAKAKVRPFSNPNSFKQNQSILDCCILHPLPKEMTGSTFIRVSVEVLVAAD